MEILKNKKHLHFIGIGGSGMYPLVQILHSQGYTITGSDVNEGDIISSERKLGIKVNIPHDENAVIGCDAVIYSAAIFKDNEELLKAKELGIPCYERSIILGEVSRLFKNSICISGTHGKTTTTGMTSQVFVMADKDPSLVIGGKLPLINGYGKSGNSSIAVIEACEYSYTFLELSPYIALILNIDHDHLEFFKTYDNLKKSFLDFAKLATGYVVINGDDKDTIDTIKNLSVPIITFGLENDADYKAVNIRKNKGDVFFTYDVEYKNKIISTITLSVSGRHNIYNSLAAFVCSHLLKVDTKDIEKGLNAFGGTGRRFEVLGKVNGVTIADDYAHHPAEITATLNAAKEMGFKRIIAVHQPFTYSRTKMLLDDFAVSLALADEVVLTKIMGSRETNTIGIYSKDLAKKIDGCQNFEEFSEVVDYLSDKLKEGDLVITLGCGDIYKAAKQLLEKLKENA